MMISDPHPRIRPVSAARRAALDEQSGRIDAMFAASRAPKVRARAVVPEVADCTSCGRAHWHPNGSSECVSCEIARAIGRRIERRAALAERAFR